MARWSVAPISQYVLAWKEALDQEAFHSPIWCIHRRIGMEITPDRVERLLRVYAEGVLTTGGAGVVAGRFA